MLERRPVRAERQHGPTNETTPGAASGAAGGAGRGALAASVGSVVAALVASLGCVGPLAFALLGVGGAGFLTKFEHYGPCLIAGTFAQLGVGFYLVYRKPKAATAHGGAEGACPAPGGSRAAKIVLWGATALTVAFLILPYLAARLAQ